MYSLRYKVTTSTCDSEGRLKAEYGATIGMKVLLLNGSANKNGR